MKPLCLVTLIICLSLQAVWGQNPFITRWDLSIENSSQIRFNATVGAGTVASYSWSEVSGSANGSGELGSGTSLRTISGLPQNSVIELQIQPANLKRFFFDGGVVFGNNLLTDVIAWGDVEWTSMEYAFNLCTNLNITAIDVPNLSLVQNMSFMFTNTNMDGPANIGTWNTENITNMYCLFQYSSSFNQDIGGWNTENVTNMTGMFIAATSFNQDIGA
jgi:surface protein